MGKILNIFIFVIIMILNITILNITIVDIIIILNIMIVDIIMIVCWLSCGFCGLLMDWCIALIKVVIGTFFVVHH